MTYRITTHSSLVASERTRSALSACARIQTINQIAKIAIGGRKTLYRLKAEVISHCLLKFPDLFIVTSYELDRTSVILSVRMPKGRIHVPFSRLSESARQAVDLSSIPYLRTIARKNLVRRASPSSRFEIMQPDLSQNQGPYSTGRKLL